MARHKNRKTTRNPVARAPQAKRAHAHQTDVYAPHSVKRRKAREALRKGPIEDSPLRRPSLSMGAAVSA